LLVVCSRLAGKIDAFMLKILIEQELGYPAELVPDGLSPEIPSNLTGPASVYEALASGAVHMYPEVALARFFSASLLRIPTPEPNAGLAFGRGRVV
jgi:hypothetical protein